LSQPQPTPNVLKCPHCGTGVKVRPDDRGTRRACPSCGKGIAVGTPSLPAGQSPDAVDTNKRPPKRHPDVPVVCRLCGTRTYAFPEQIGQSIPCPDCTTQNIVEARKPKQQQKRWDAVKLNDGDDLRLSEDVDQPDPEKNRSFRIICPRCQSQLHIHVDQVGETVTCSDCDLVMEVPKPPRPKSKTRLDWEDPGLDIGPPETTDLPKVNADALLSQADDELQELERAKPVPPKRPFDDGVYTFPFRLAVLPLTAVFCFLACAIAMLRAAGMEMEGPAMVVGLLLTMAAGLLALVLLIFGSVCCLAILEETSRCVDQIKEWPPFDIGFWGWNTLFVVSAIAVSLLPCLLFELVSKHALVVVGPVFLFMLFPIVLLGEMESNSPGFPYSAQIIRSLRELRSAWMSFYMRVFLMALLLLLLGWACWYQQFEPTLVLITACLAAIMSIIYFRLLGRLAWVISEQLEIEEDSEADTEDPLAPKLPGATSA